MSKYRGRSWRNWWTNFHALIDSRRCDNRGISWSTSSRGIFIYTPVRKLTCEAHTCVWQFSLRSRWREAASWKSHCRLSEGNHVWIIEIARYLSFYRIVTRSETSRRDFRLGCFGSFSKQLWLASAWISRETLVCNSSVSDRGLRKDCSTGVGLIGFIRLSGSINRKNYFWEVSVKSDTASTPGALRSCLFRYRENQFFRFYNFTWKIRG